MTLVHTWVVLSVAKTRSRPRLRILFSSLILNPKGNFNSLLIHLKQRYLGRGFCRAARHDYRTKKKTQEAVLQNTVIYVKYHWLIKTFHTAKIENQFQRVIWLVAKETAVLFRWDSETQKFGCKFPIVKKWTKRIIHVKTVLQSI